MRCRAMYIAICDDQINELERIVNLLHIWEKEHNTTLRFKIFQSAAEMLDAAAASEKEPFSLYLLDVMMPRMDGIAVAREIRSFDEAADIVFFTASQEFAYASYGVRALNYLLKPIQPEDLFPLLNRLFLHENNPQEYLLLKSGATLIRAPFSQIVYVEVMNKCLYYHLTDNTVKQVSGTLRQCEPFLLSRPEFKRIHRSYIVNLMKVIELSPTTARTVLGKELPVSRGLHQQLQKDYVKLLFTRENKT